MVVGSNPATALRSSVAQLVEHVQKTHPEFARVVELVDTAVLEAVAKA